VEYEPTASGRSRAARPLRGTSGVVDAVTNGTGTTIIGTPRVAAPATFSAPSLCRFGEDFVEFLARGRCGHLSIRLARWPRAVRWRHRDRDRPHPQE
jgi:hypothetical protein